MLFCLGLCTMLPCLEMGAFTKLFFVDDADEFTVIVCRHLFGTFLWETLL